jgi:hypothetical protein
MPLVRRRASPVRAPLVVTSRSFATSPSMVPTTMGRARPCVTSVWPPDHERVPAEILADVGDEGDRVGRGHHVAVAHVEDGGILPHPRAQHDALVEGDVLGEQAAQQAWWDLADRQSHDWAVTSGSSVTLSMVGMVTSCRFGRRAVPV